MRQNSSFYVKYLAVSGTNYLSTNLPQSLSLSLFLEGADVVAVDNDNLGTTRLSRNHAPAALNSEGFTFLRGRNYICAGMPR